MSGLITNPVVVQNALKSKTVKKKKPQQQEKDKDGTATPKKGNAKKKKQAQTGSGESAASATASAHGSTEDLRRALFPDLYAAKEQKPQKTSSTPKKNKKSKENTPSPQQSSLFAGSSFHSSPAPSSLPKPTFKSKAAADSVPAEQVLPAATPPSQYAMPAAGPIQPGAYAAPPFHPVHARAAPPVGVTRYDGPVYPVQPYPPPAAVQMFQPYQYPQQHAFAHPPPPPPPPIPPANMTPANMAPAGNFNLFDQFMLADRQEKAAAQQRN